jgi:hypothetical protein
MCWNEEISFMTALMSTVIAIYIKNRGNTDDNWCGNVLLSIAAMQYIEFFTWIIIKNKNYNKNENLKLANKILAVFAIPFVLALQPLISYSGALQNNYMSKNFLPFYILYSIVVFTFLSINRRKNYIYKQNNLQKTLFNEGNYLDWGHRKIPFILGLIHMIIIFLPFFTQIKKTFVKLMLISGFFTAYVFSASASRWCLYTNIWSIIFLFK